MAAKTTPQCNPGDIRRTLELLSAADAVAEIRILKTGKTKTVRGYFDRAHLDKAVESILYWNGKAPAIYATLNPVNPALLARSANRLEPYAETTTGDADITARRWLLVDADPVRPSGISSNDDEHGAALECIKKIRSYLKGPDWPAPVAADSGNGGHLLYRIDLPNNDASKMLLHRCLQSLAAKFDDDAVKIDTGVYNASRISKLYGTLTCKGDNTTDRPHRLARLLTVPKALNVVTVEQLQALADQAPQPVKPARTTPTKPPQADNFFDNVNQAALGNLTAWVPALFSTAKPYREGYRVRSKDLNRDLQEDLSLQPDGIRDFGTERGLTAIDTVLEWGNTSDAKAAAFWLCQQLGIESAQLGWREPRRPDPSQFYAVEHGVICHLKNGVPHPLCNFQFHIDEEVIKDGGDGDETRHYIISGQLASGQILPPITIPASRYAGMNWPSEWGAGAVVYAGQSTRDHLRAAGQLLSKPTVRRVFTHTGTRQLNGQWVYLHAGGTITPDGVREDVQVELDGDAQRYSLPPPDPSPEAISASLLLLDLCPLIVSAPLFLAAYRAPLIEVLPVDFTIWILGDTGAGKSVLAGIVQGHFGAEWGGDHFPDNCSSTANISERRQYFAKSAVCTKDDYNPEGTATDVARLNKTITHLVRNQGNRAGRGRMNADGSERKTYYSRCLPIVTGEDLVPGASIRARLFTVEIDHSTIEQGILRPGAPKPAGSILNRLSQARELGVLAGTMAGYIQYVLRHMERLQATLPQRFAELRDSARIQGHARYSSTVASLFIAAEIFHEYATAQGVELPADWLPRIWAVLVEQGNRQAHFLGDVDPARLFLRLIVSVLSSHRAHLGDAQNPDGEVMDSNLGWRRVDVGAAEYHREEWHPQGPKIGWIDGEDIYLIPETSYQIAQQYAGDRSNPINKTPQGLRKSLYESGLLASVSQQGERIVYTVRKKINGKRFHFIHIKNNVLYGNHGDLWVFSPPPINNEGSEGDSVDSSDLKTNHKSEKLTTDEGELTTDEDVERI